MSEQVVPALPPNPDPCLNGDNPELVAEHGLLPEEYENALGILGRVPNLTELGIFSVMWSEHCAYKNTRRLLRLLPYGEGRQGRRRTGARQGWGRECGGDRRGEGWGLPSRSSLTIIPAPSSLSREPRPGWVESFGIFSQWERDRSC